MKNLRINDDRLWGKLMEMAQLGATEKGGVCRLALSKHDFRARTLFQTWCEKLGMEVRHDAMGNQFARLQGREYEAKPILMGSHLDSQPTGGKFDGALGVLAGLEVIQTLIQADHRLQHPLELVNWTNEEGARFAPAMIGSGVFAGEFDLHEAHAIKDKDGISMKESLMSIGFLGDSMEHQDYAASLELHIEQGPVLEQDDKTIGVVTGVQGVRWYEVTVIGKPAHAGTTPMAMRLDPIPVAMKFIQAVYELAEKVNQAKVTIGTFAAEPGAINTVPEKVRFNIDLRHPEKESHDRLNGDLIAITGSHKSKGIEVVLQEIWNSPPIQFHSTCIEAVKNASQQLGYPHKAMFSGAGHDSVYLNRVMPTGMIFIPCKDGLSHNEAESIKKEHAAAGSNVLLHSVLNLDNLTI